MVSIFNMFVVYQNILGSPNQILFCSSPSKDDPTFSLVEERQEGRGPKSLGCTAVGMKHA